MRISDWSSDVCSSDLIGGTQDISDTAHQVVDNCLFEGGSLAFNLAGTNLPGPLIYTNNQHFNQPLAGSRFYHAWQALVDNLLYEGIRGAVASDASLLGFAARKSVGSGESVSVRVVLVGRRSL